MSQAEHRNARRGDGRPIGGRTRELTTGADAVAALDRLTRIIESWLIPLVGHPVPLMPIIGIERHAQPFLLTIFTRS